MMGGSEVTLTIHLTIPDEQVYSISVYYVSLITYCPIIGFSRKPNSH